MDSKNLHKNIYTFLILLMSIFIVLALFYKLAIFNKSQIVMPQVFKNKSEYNTKANLFKSKSLLYSFDVSVASDKASRTLGLSYTDSLCQTCGKLFVFDNEGYYLFWMKDMNYDLDILYLNQNKEVVNIFRNVKKESYPGTIENSIPAQYVFEINSGLSDSLNIEVGDRLEF